jgi:CDP-2,3-bis-(O-geranylgeranyl)-sn-glycerol synthase
MPGAEVLIAAVLLVTSHSTPAVVGGLLGPHGAWPIDGGLELRDGNRLFGRSKTWRGLALALTASAVATSLLLQRPGLGIAFAALAMAGDLGSSFVKRRRGLPPHTDALFLDQLPESLLPLIVLRDALQMSWMEVIVLAMVFVPANLVANRSLEWLLARARRSPGR